MCEWGKSVTFVKFWKEMASELQETLTRIVNKSNILIEKYHALEDENKHLVEQVAQLQSEVERLRKEGEHLEIDNRYLKVAHNIAPDAESAKSAKAIISSLVRDIDRCISQLNE